MSVYYGINNFTFSWSERRNRDLENPQDSEAIRARGIIVKCVNFVMLGVFYVDLVLFIPLYKHSVEIRQ